MKCSILALGHYIAATQPLLCLYGNTQLRSLQLKQSMSCTWCELVKKKFHQAHLPSSCSQALGWGDRERMEALILCCVPLPWVRAEPHPQDAHKAVTSSSLPAPPKRAHQVCTAPGTALNFYWWFGWWDRAHIKLPLGSNLRETTNMLKDKIRIQSDLAKHQKQPKGKEKKETWKG